MKKLFVMCAVLLFVAPAFAADWSFYGSERMATWYNYKDFGKNQVAGQDNEPAPNGTCRPTRASRQDQGRQVHRPDRTGDDQTSTTESAGDGTVNTRRAYGVWKFTDNAWLKVGKDYSPVTDFVSSQAYDADNSLYGNGEFYGRRPQGLTLGVGNFEIAFLTPQQGNTGGIGSTTTGILSAASTTALTQTNSTGDPDVYFPKSELPTN